MSDSVETIVLDHSCLTALHEGDPFLTGLYVEASHQRGRILVPTLCILEADRLKPGCGAYAAGLRYVEAVPFTTAHALEALSWPRAEPAVTHTAAVAWCMAVAGEPVTVLSLRADAYGFAGVHALDPHD